MKRCIAVLFFVMIQVCFSQWEPCNENMWGGRLKTLINHGDTLFAGAISGNVFRSTDNGSTWEAKSEGLPLENVYYTEGNHIALCGDRLLATARYSLFISDDWGDSWKKIEIKSNDYDALSTIYSYGDTVIIAKGQQLLISTDKGAKWKTIAYKNMYCGFTCFYKHKNKLFAGRALATDYSSLIGVCCSSDNGATWVDNKNGIEFARAFSMAGEGSNVYIATDEGFFISRDDGDNWQKQNIDTEGVQITSVAVRGRTVIAGAVGRGVYVSTNRGNTWTLKGKELGLIYTSSIMVNGLSIFLATGSDGVFKSTDNCDTWQEKNKGMDDIGVQNYTANGNELWALVRSGTPRSILYYSSNRGDSWVAKYPKLQDLRMSSIVVSGDSVWIATDYSTNFRSRLLMSSDKGESWVKRDSGLNSAVHSVVRCGSTLFAGTSDGVMMSGKGGEYWIMKSFEGTDIASLASWGSSLMALSFNKSNVAEYYISTDFGESWVKNESLAYGQTASAGNMVCIVNDTLLQLSMDAGVSWTKKKLPNIFGYVKSIALDGHTIILSSGKGLISASKDYGQTWEQTVSNPVVYITNLKTADGYMYGNEWEGRIFRAPLNDFVGVDEITKSGSGAIQISPNPARGKIHLRIDNPVQTARVEIFNCLGNRVMELGGAEPEMTISTESLPAGIYVVRVSDGKSAATAKVVVGK